MDEEDENQPSSGALIRWLNSGIFFRKASGRCPVCGEAFAKTAQMRLCPRCQTPHHDECWQYIGDCGVFGCHQPRRPRPPRPPGDGETPGQAAPGPSILAQVFNGLVFSFCLVGVLALAGSTCGRPDHRTRANTRACYANQKTVAGALEMYALDKNTKLTALDSSVWFRLKSGGYLQAIPQDPGFGPGSSSNYQWTSADGLVRCVVHGLISDRSSR
ncbi:MAG: hypothetical protein HY815_09810 [Candidatus Riflebacteria bacterium]|nr:hypothetical protein [Candidatus Riflebacteria bacterium]